MGKESNSGLKLFLEMWLLIALLAAFNFYMYYDGGQKKFLVMGIGTAVAFVGFGLFYVIYVRRGER
jgi:NADH:ubiquinone oxidoreductase subunit K